MIGFGGEDDSNGFHKLVMKSSKQKQKKPKLTQVVNISETDHDVSQNFQKEGEENYLRQQSTVTEKFFLQRHFRSSQYILWQMKTQLVLVTRKQKDQQAQLNNLQTVAPGKSHLRRPVNLLRSMGLSTLKYQPKLILETTSSFFKSICNIYSIL